MKNLFGKLSGGQRKIVCPKCLKTIRDADADNPNRPCEAQLNAGCYRPLPLRYVRDFSTAEPLPIQVFGWSGHGKTVFLDALRLMLLDMRKLWPDYTFQAISEEDMKKETELRGTLRQGKMPPSTTRVSDLGELKVNIMKLEKMAGYRNKWLVVMDYPGELFQAFDVRADLMPFLKGSPTTFFIISIPLLTDPSRPTGESIDQLMNIYIETMLRLEKQGGRKSRDGLAFTGDKRQVIVVLTMADLLVGRMPVELRRYLQNDTLWTRLRSPNSQPFSIEEMHDYFAEMERVSDQIRDWLLTDSDGAPGGSNLVGLLESTEVTAHYSMISAVGFQPDSDNPMPIQPKRVLDPFLWALQFDRQFRE